MKVPYFDLKQQYASIKDEVDQAISNVLNNTSYILGPAVESFENDFASYCGSNHCVCVNSGTSALQLALLALDIGPKDQVITVSATFVATVAAVTYTGATPVIIDIDPQRRTMDPNKIEEAICADTKAILPVHLYGMPANMAEISNVAEKYNLPIIEDAAQAHGAMYQGKRTGSYGLVGCFSFYPGKNLGAYGEGGAIVTNDSDIARKVRLLRDWGSSQKYKHELRGFNMRMEGIQGAVLGVKLKYLDAWNERRQYVARIYNEALTGHEHICGPMNYIDSMCVFHVYGVQVRNRDHFIGYMANLDISCSIHYPCPVHKMIPYIDICMPVGSLHNTEALFNSVVSLPMYPEMSDEMVSYVANALKEYKYNE